MTCLGAKGFLLTMTLVSIAGKYEWQPLQYSHEYWPNSTTYSNFTERIEIAGVTISFSHSSYHKSIFNSQYSSNVIKKF